MFYSNRITNFLKYIIEDCFKILFLLIIYPVMHFYRPVTHNILNIKKISTTIWINKYIHKGGFLYESFCWWMVKI